MKIHTEVPGWRYWFDTSHKVWVGERAGWRITCGNKIRLVVAMMSEGELSDCTYKQVKPVFSPEQLEGLASTLREKIDRAVVLGDEWDRDDKKWSAYSDATAEVYDLVKENANEIVCCIRAAAEQQTKKETT